MRVVRRFIVGVSSALVGWALLLGSSALSARSAAPRIEALDVERVESLAPGTRLNFSLFGSAGGRAWLHIDGAQRVLELREVQPGVYDGSHVVDAQDRLGAHTRVQATLRIGDRSTQALLAEPLLLGVDSRPAGTTIAQPPVDAPPAGPAGRAGADAPDAALASPAPAAPTASPAPAAPAAPATVLPPPVVLPPPFVVPTPAARPCDDCARVESIRRIDPEAPASGGLIATLFGERVAGELDRHFARLHAPLDRAVGRQRAASRYEATLRLPTGERLVRSYEQPPTFKVGDVVALGANLGGARSERLIDEPPAASRREP